MQIYTVDKYGGIYGESIEPIDAVNILPLARFEPTTSATPLYMLYMAHSINKVTI